MIIILENEYSIFWKSPMRKDGLSFNGDRCSQFPHPQNPLEPAVELSGCRDLTV